MNVPFKTVMVEYEEELKPQKDCLQARIDEAIKSKFRCPNNDSPVYLGRIEEFNHDELSSAGRIYIENGIVYCTQSVTRLHSLTLAVLREEISACLPTSWSWESKFWFPVFCKHTCGAAYRPIPDGIIGYEFSNGDDENPAGQFEVVKNRVFPVAIEFSYENLSRPKLIMKSLNYLNNFGCFFYSLAAKISPHRNYFCLEIILLKRISETNPFSLQSVKMLEAFLDRQERNEGETFAACEPLGPDEYPDFDTEDFSLFGVEVVQRWRVTDENIDQDIIFEIDTSEFVVGGGILTFIISSAALMEIKLYWEDQRA